MTVELSLFQLFRSLTVHPFRVNQSEAVSSPNFICCPSTTRLCGHLEALAYLDVGCVLDVVYPLYRRQTHSVSFCDLRQRVPFLHGVYTGFCRARRGRLCWTQAKHLSYGDCVAGQTIVLL